MLIEKKMLVNGFSEIATIPLVKVQTRSDCAVIHTHALGDNIFARHLSCPIKSSIFYIGHHIFIYFTNNC